MRHIVFALVLLLLTSGKSYGQKTLATITDVDFRLENNLIVINYSITGAFLNEVFEIGVHFLTQSGQKIIPVSIRGDIGKNILAGSLKTIYWDIDNDRIEISGEIKAVVTIVSSQIPYTDPFGGTAQVRGEKPLAGPGAMGLSILVPSLGGYFVEKKKTNAIITSITIFTFAVSAASLNSRITQYETDWDNATSQTERNEIDTKIETAEQNYALALTGLTLVWIIDICRVALKGAQNQRNGLTKKKPAQYNYSEGFNLNYTGKQLCVGYRITF
jgi:hypothetical protein